VKLKGVIMVCVQTKTLTLPLKDGISMPKLGQGTWHMGEVQGDGKKEIDALKYGIELGITMIDTAEMYADGRAEEIVGEAISKLIREDLFIVSKVYPHNAGRRRIFQSCEASLKRLGTDYLDMYLLHWRGSVPLGETVECMEELKAQGKILAWGVSNFDTDDMLELLSTPNGERCAVNQVLYHLGSRGIEYSLLPLLAENNIPVMAYCPVAQGGRLQKKLAESAAVIAVAEKHGVSPIQVLLAFVLNRKNVVAIPKAVGKEHVRQNADATKITLTEEDIHMLNREFPAPTQKVPLEIR
jgi:diketogulonate reductase-like aldo/keto reductase